MQRVRCETCGLVNFAVDSTCRRCGRSLANAPAEGAGWSDGGAPPPSYGWQEPAAGEPQDVEPGSASVDPWAFRKPPDAAGPDDAPDAPPEPALWPAPPPAPPRSGWDVPPTSSYGDQHAPPPVQPLADRGGMPPPAFGQPDAWAPPPYGPPPEQRPFAPPPDLGRSTRPIAPPSTGPTPNQQPWAGNPTNPYAPGGAGAPPYGVPQMAAPLTRPFGAVPDPLAQAERDAKSALVASIVGLFGFCCCFAGILLGAYALIKGNAARNTFAQYGRADRQYLAVAAIVIGTIDVIANFLYLMANILPAIVR